MWQDQAGSSVHTSKARVAVYPIGDDPACTATSSTKSGSLRILVVVVLGVLQIPKLDVARILVAHEKGTRSLQPNIRTIRPQRVFIVWLIVYLSYLFLCSLLVVTVKGPWEAVRSSDSINSMALSAEVIVAVIGVFVALPQSILCLIQVARLFRRDASPGSESTAPHQSRSRSYPPNDASTHPPNERLSILPFPSSNTIHQAMSPARTPNIQLSTPSVQPSIRQSATSNRHHTYRTAESFVRSPSSPAVPLTRLLKQTRLNVDTSSIDLDSTERRNG